MVEWTSWEKRQPKKGEVGFMLLRDTETGLTSMHCGSVVEEDHGTWFHLLGLRARIYRMSILLTAIEHWRPSIKSSW